MTRTASARATRPGRRAGFWLSAAAALAILVAAYSNHFDNGFYFDDAHVIVNNPYIRSLGNVPRFFTDAATFSTNPRNATYRPLLSLTYALDYARAGELDPRAFHETQFALLVILWALLVPTARRVFDAGRRAPENRFLGLFAATLFCLHTANTQTVNYLSSRSSLIATLGVVGSFWIFVWWPHRRWTLAYLLPMGVAVLAKPVAVMFAPIAFAWVWLVEERSAVTDLRSARGWCAAAQALRTTAPALGAAALLFGLVSRLDAGTVDYGSQLDRLHYLHTQVFVWLHYARLFVLPVGLTADTDWTLLPHWSDTRFFVGLLFVAAAGLAVERCSRTRRWRPVAFGIVWFFLGLAPSSSVVPLYEVYNEHRIFLPFVGLTLAATWAGWTALRGWALRRHQPERARRLGGTLAVLCVAAHAVGTHERNRVWASDESLWADVVAKSPENGRGLMNYGISRMRRGDYAGALELFERARRYAPGYAYLYTNIGILKAAQGDFVEADRAFHRALELDPRFTGGYLHFAHALTQQGRGPEAVDLLQRGLAVRPDEVRIRTQLMRLLAARGDLEAARELARGTLAIDPRDLAARALLDGALDAWGEEASLDAWIRRGLDALEADRWLEAAEIFRVLAARHPGSAVVRNDLGWARLQLGFVREAVADFERAVELDPTFDLARSNRAYARERLAESGPPR